MGFSTKRRTLLKAGAISGASLVAISTGTVKLSAMNDFKKFPVVISTWNHGLAANAEAWKVLIKGGNALDAVEQGVRQSELDPGVSSVGYGGLPDRDGNVTLDACIMDDQGRAGSVCFLQHIKTPISVARLVMEKTDHVMLAGEGALKFALTNGFTKENLLTGDSKKFWEEWKKSGQGDYLKNDNANHDTIGMVAIDFKGNLSGACTTSGLAWKMFGRVGDSPIIGAGLYVDNEVGAAAATGKGEAVIKTCGSFLVVELMRQGYGPEDACRMAVQRIIKHYKERLDFQVGFIALNKAGVVGGFSIKEGFQYALYQNHENRLIDSGFLL